MNPPLPANLGLSGPMGGDATPVVTAKHFLVRITDTGPLMDHLIGYEPRRVGRAGRPRRLADVSARGVALVLGFWAASAGSDGLAVPPGERPEADIPPRVAAAPREIAGGPRSLEATPAPSLRDPAGHPDGDPIERAKRAIADCEARYRSVKDYTCKFFKVERIDGRLVRPHIMHMKARTEPTSFYFKFVQPNAGREAIYVAGKNKGRVFAHDVGLGRVLAGTMNLDPLGSMAMEENRHPVTEAGIGALIATVRHRWDVELRHGEAKVLFHPAAKVGDRACRMIETIHPTRHETFMFHKVKLYIDDELGLPIRFEAYDWPRGHGHEPELVEEYTYANLRVNVGLHERDFDPQNAQYSFGRF